MSKKFSKWCTLLLVLVLTASTLAACASKKTTEPIASASASATPVVDYFSKGKFDPPVTISTMGCTNATMKFKNGETIENNIHTKWAKEKLGIDIKYKWVTDDAQCTTKLRLALASNEPLPDVMATNDPQLISELLDSGKLMEIGPAFDKYASDFVKSIYKQDPTYWYGVTRDNKKLGFALLSEAMQNDSVLWLREDWLKTLNMQAPKNFDELEQLMEAMMTKNPDGKGTKITPLTLGFKDGGFQNWMSDGSWIFGGYGAIPGDWNKWNGGKTLEYGSIQPEVKLALAKLAEWFKKGYISKDVALHDAIKASELITSEKAGIIAGPSWMAGWPLNDVTKTNPKASFQPYPLPAGPTGKVGRQSTKVPYGTLLVSKDFKHIDALMLYLNTLWEGNDPKKGSEFERGWAENYDYVMIDGKISSLEKDIPGGKVYVPKYFLMNQPLRDPMLSLNTTLKFYKGEKPTTPFEIVTYSSATDAEKADPKLNKNWRATSIKNDQKNAAIANLFTAAATPTMKTKFESMNKLEVETFMKIIYGSAPIDEFDKFVQQWKALGGDQITKEVNDWYKSVGGK